MSLVITDTKKQLCYDDKLYDDEYKRKFEGSSNIQHTSPNAKTRCSRARVRYRSKQLQVVRGGQGMLDQFHKQISILVQQDATQAVFLTNWVTKRQGKDATFA